MIILSNSNNLIGIGSFFHSGSVDLTMAHSPLKVFSRTAGPILSRIGTSHPWEEGLKFVQIKGIASLRGKVIAEM
jgi:hypothetical protein